MMLIQLNGKPREVGEGLTISGLLDALEIKVRHVAVERNRQVVPRAEHPAVRIEPGDELEVVTLVGGG
jgi:sulfur carrier protein